VCMRGEEDGAGGLIGTAAGARAAAEEGDNSGDGAGRVGNAAPPVTDPAVSGSLGCLFVHPEVEPLWEMAQRIASRCDVAAVQAGGNDVVGEEGGVVDSLREHREASRVRVSVRAVA
jgi:hypothetical protein